MIMKKLYILNMILFLFVFYGFSQKIKIKGEVYQENRVYKDEFAFRPIPDSFHIDPVEKFALYLTDQPNESSNRMLVLESDTSVFNIKIPPRLVENFKYLEFSSIEHMTYLRIDTLKQTVYKIILKYVPALIKKPAIYLYPESRIEISVKHDFKGEITTTYPEYHDGWKVIASPDGKLFNTVDNRTYTYLFWEGKYGFPESHYRFYNGFYVEKKDNIEFLQTKLVQIGLNETEINDFINFWLPMLNQNPYNFIHFRINDNIDNTSFLNINPEPETLLRVFMEFKGIQSLKGRDKLPEQELTTLQRKGFTVVEWGGAEIPEFNLVSKE
jgi:hypothetical protein